MTCLLKSLSASASTISSSLFYNVLNCYCLYLGNSLKSSLSPFVGISKIYLSDFNFFQFLANNLVLPPINFVVNSNSFTCFSICSSDDKIIFFAGYDGCCCCSVLSLAVSVSTRFANSLGFWGIAAIFMSS